MHFFDAKEYDIASFNKVNGDARFEIHFFETRLNKQTADLAAGCDAVCLFVNDTVDRNVIDRLWGHGVKILALRCAGYNNVDMEYASGRLRVVRVPAYSPYAVAEHAKASRSFNRIWKERDSAQPKLLEAILYKDNFNRAYKRVKANKGAPGTDGMTIEEALPYGDIIRQ